MGINSVLRESINYEDLRRRLLDASPDLDERTLLDTLEGATNLQEAVAAVIRSALDDEALARVFRSRIEEMRQRLSRIESTAETKREAALNAMERADMIKLMAPDFTVSIRINARRHQQRLGGAWRRSVQFRDNARHQDQIT